MRITLGVTGGVAAYKAAELVRRLQQGGFSVQVVMTRGAREFVTPLTFAALSGQKVITDLFSDSSGGEANLESAIEHIAVAQRTDLLLVAPATADIIAKFARGIADDFLTTLYLAPGPDHAPAVRDLLTCPLPGVDQLALFPLADAVAAPHPTAIGIPASVVPAFHGGLLSSGAVHKTIALRLDGGALPRYDIWSSVERVVRVSSSAWQVPPLPLSLNPAWGHPPGDSPSCAAMAAVLRQWVGGSSPG